MAGARRKSGSKGRARKRDKNGHFVSAARKAARRTAKANPRKRAKKRTAAKRRTTVRIKRALGRKKTTGKFTRRSRTRVRGYRRKVKGRSKKTLVRSHLSYEAPVKRKRARRAPEASMAQANPRRRAKRRRVSKRRRNPIAAAAEVMENPRKRRRAKRKSAKRRSTRRSPVRRRKTAKRRSSARRSATRTIIVMAPRRRKSSKRRSSKRRAAPRRRKSAKRRSRKITVYKTPSNAMWSIAGANESWFANPLGSNFLENPLSGGELALAAATGSIGYVLTDLLDRYLAIKQYATTANGVTLQPSAAVRTKPGITRILAQAAAAAVPLGAAYFVNEPMGRAALQGAGLGALFHLGGQLVSHYAMTWLGTKVTAIAPYYQMETQADSYADQYNGVPVAAGVTPVTGTLAGLARVQQLAAAPVGVGRANVLRRQTAPSVPFHSPGPTATGVAALPTTGVGDCGCGPEASAPSNGSDTGCGPCDDSGQQPPVPIAQPAPPGRSAMAGLGSPYAMFDAAE